MSILDTPLVYPPEPTRAWSPLQTAIFDAIASTTNDLLVQAVAGSGKTTTIVEGTSYASGTSLFMAFNKSIALDIAAKAPACDVKTLNALGHRIVTTMRPRAKLDARKTDAIVKATFTPSEVKDYGYTLSRVIGLAKNNAVGVGDDFDEWPSMIADIIDAYQFDIPSDLIDDFANRLATVLQLSIDDQSTFDFDDQLYLPIYNSWAFPLYDTIFVDECQDLSPIQHLMLSALQDRGARIIAVGDRHQAIYGFRGAMSNSMDALKAQFSMVELPLSISYRCAQSIVREAQKFCHTISWHTGAPEGWVGESVRDPSIFPDSLIVCRNNAPLFKAILRHVRAQEPCKVLSNFLDSFQGFIRGFKCSSTTDLRRKLDAWRDKEVAAAKAKGFRGKVYTIMDRYETLAMFCNQYTTVDDILSVVARLSKGVSGPTFATIHKAKGLEHTSVHILRPDLLPASYATTKDQLQQEANLQYVAITRAKEKLVYGETLS